MFNSIPMQYKADFSAAKRFGAVRVGESCVYVRRGLGFRAIPGAELEQARLRVHEACGKMCCGRASFDYAGLIISTRGAELPELLYEDVREAEGAIEAIRALCPGAVVGVLHKSDDSKADN